MNPIEKKIRAVGGTVLSEPLLRPDGEINQKCADQLFAALGESEWETRARKLWQLLDDISTCFDAYHPRIEPPAFETSVQRLCEQRCRYLYSLDGHKLLPTPPEPSSVPSRNDAPQIAVPLDTLLELREALDQRYCGAEDSGTRWMSEWLDKLDKLLPDSPELEDNLP